MEGFIQMHRKLLEWEWYDDINVKVLFIHLLLKANWSDKEWRGIIIKEWQLLTWRIKLSEETWLSQQQVRTSLKKLESTNNITIKTTNRNSIIEVLNYKQYQQVNQQTTKQATNKQPTSNQQVTTTNNINNNNKINNKKSFWENNNVFMLDSEYEKLIQKFWKYPTDSKIEDISAYIKNFPAKGKKYKCHYSVACQWFKKEWVSDMTRRNTLDFNTI